jgi:protein SCO1/2
MWKTLAAGLYLVALSACTESRAASLEHLRGVRLTPAQRKTDFTLDDTQGRPFRFASDTHGLVTLLYFGYTHCPDVCPTHLANIAAALKKLSPADQAKVRVVFVTTDPERDTPQRLRSWLDNFDQRFIGLRGTLDAVNTVQARYGLPPATMEPMDSSAAGPRAAYGMGHAAQVLAFTPDDSLRVEYPSGFTADDFANDLPRLARIR